MEAESSHKDMAVSFLGLVAAGNIRDAYERYVDANFRHHNAIFRGERPSLIDVMRENAEERPNKLLEVKRTLEDGDFVAVHSCIRQSSHDLGAAAVHIFRFEDDRIAELWDIGQPAAEDSPNNLGML